MRASPGPGRTLHNASTATPVPTVASNFCTSTAIRTSGGAPGRMLALTAWPGPSCSREVAGDDARNRLLQRFRPAMEIEDLHAVRRRARATICGLSTMPGIPTRVTDTRMSRRCRRRRLLGYERRRLDAQCVIVRLRARACRRSRRERQATQGTSRTPTPTAARLPRPSGGEIPLASGRVPSKKPGSLSDLRGSLLLLPFAAQ